MFSFVGKLSLTVQPVTPDPTLHCSRKSAQNHAIMHRTTSCSKLLVEHLRLCNEQSMNQSSTIAPNV